MNTEQYTAIADDIAANNGGTVDGAGYEIEFARMSEETVSVKKNFQTSDIKRYLMLVDKWLPLKASADPVAQAAIEALTIFSSFEFADENFGAQVEAKVGQICDGLISINMIDATDKGVIMGFGNVTEPKWPNLLPKHVEAAIVLRIKGRI